MIRTGTAVQETEGGRYNLAGRSAHRRHLWRQSRGDARRNYGDRFPWWRSDNIYAGASRPGRTAPSSWRLHAVASAGGWCGACTNVAEGHECFITSSFKEWKKKINQWVELIKAKKVERGECGPPARAGELQVWPLKLCLSLVLIPLKGPVESRGPPNPPLPVMRHLDLDSFTYTWPGSIFPHQHNTVALGCEIYCIQISLWKKKSSNQRFPRPPCGTAMISIDNMAAAILFREDETRSCLKGETI